MYSREDILRLMTEQVHHPATARELAQLLRVPREERASFKRQLKALVAEGELLQIRGNRFGLAEKMDSSSDGCRPTPAVSASSCPSTPRLQPVRRPTRHLHRGRAT